MTLFNLKHASIKQKIGGLFVVLLGFLFCVIIFSAYKLHELEQDMKEVAYLDIPLSQIITQIEFIELEQHLQLEEYQLQQSGQKQDLKPHQEFVFQKKKLKKLVDKAVNLLETNLKNDSIVLDPADHQTVLNQLEIYRIQSEQYEQHLDHIYQQDGMSQTELKLTENLADKLETEEKQLITLLGNLATKDAYYTEQHEENFFIINSVLGASALVLGLFLTLYIIQIIVTRIQSIQTKIKSFDRKLETHSDIQLSTEPQPQTTKDELEELEFDVQTLMSKLTREIATREQVEKQLLYLATRDKLTGLFNRHKWDEEINMHISLAQRDCPFGLMLLDIDYFKKINDKYGHLAGDKVLKVLAHSLSNRVRDVDMIFRLGGEEFAIICPMKDVSYTEKVAEEIRGTVQNLDIENLPGFTVSIGVATYQDLDNSASIFKRADMALYQAKAQGRNQVVTEEQLNV
ncbi:GGDEF domain-containing protein [Vibrio viridaestus]|uniref:diguanylate cyclase n=1 Tax=Vibrio viridaestus TaxID=2487322 RepID=A0A3N9TLH6_9VIBR|nr:GGDEF domain-containing protein [Vibrio viridaestus]RQW64844.1 GGDEF domain-containing protein [Vibrio viridaestus]